MLGCPTVLIGESAGGGGGGFSEMPVTILLKVMEKAPASVKAQLAQIVALKDAAAAGTPFCEECAKAAIAGGQ
jgi:hypothetical protein